MPYMVYKNENTYTMTQLQAFSLAKHNVLIAKARVESAQALMLVMVVFACVSIMAKALIPFVVTAAVATLFVVVVWKRAKHVVELSRELDSLLEKYENAQLARSKDRCFSDSEDS